MRHGETMIRHALSSGTVMAISVGVHRATTRSCLIALPSFLLSIASSFLRASFDAVDLASIAPPTDQDLRAAASTPKHPARSFINTCGRACPARRIILLAAPSKRLANAHATNSAARPSILGARMAGRVRAPGCSPADLRQRPYRQKTAVSRPIYMRSSADAKTCCYCFIL